MRRNIHFSRARLLALPWLLALLVAAWGPRNTITYEPARMKTYLDCYPCFLRQALEAARMNGASKPEQRAVLDQVMRILETVDLAATPPEIAHRVHRIVCAALQVGDPYRAIKAEARAGRSICTSTSNR